MRLHFSLLLTLCVAANAQWTKVEVPTTSSLRGLSVASANVIWASGTGGTVIKTLDGGKTWALIVVPGAEKLDFRGIRAFDDQTALIMSSGPAEQGHARIYLSRNGGQSWRQVFEEKRAGIFFDAIAFWDRRHGIVLSDPIEGHFALFRTDDGGATWQQIPPAALPPSLPNEGAFAASNSCLAVQGDKNVWFASGGTGVARVFRSTDRGKTWSVVETPMHPPNASSGIFSITFRNEKFGIAVGGDYAHPGSSDLPNLMFTTDSGQRWQVAAVRTNPVGMYFSSVARLPGLGADNEEFIAVGTKGTLQFSPRLIEDDRTRLFGEDKPVAGEEELNSVAVAADSYRGPVKNLWAVGPKGIVLHRKWNNRGR